MESAGNKRFVYEFGRFVLDPEEKTLLVDGLPVHLPAKEFETLLLLVMNNGRALSKNQMISTVWQDSYVEEGNLAKQVSKLRKLLNTRGEQFIQTIPKHGYRFSADLRRVDLESMAPVIAERRTVKRIAFSVDDDKESGPTRTLPPMKGSYWRAGLLAGLILFAGAVVTLAWFWQKQNTPIRNQQRGIAFLTDGSAEEGGARWTNEGRIHFARFIGPTRVESWVMNSNGTDIRRANTEIKSLLHGVWSPDANKVVFVKEGDSKTLYLADSDGGREIVLPFAGGNMDWAPDGSKFVHQARTGPVTSELHVYTVATGDNVRLTEVGTMAADPSFSYDGKQIAFTSFHDGNGEIYVINADGSGMRRVTNHPAFDNYPVFAPDGTAIAFQSNRGNERTEVYLQNLNLNSPPRKIAAFEGHTSIGPKCWSEDGTELLVSFDADDKKAQILRIKIEPYPTEPILSDETADLDFPRLHPDGRRIAYEARLPDRSLEIRVTDLETEKTKTIFKTEPNYPPTAQLGPALSPDGTKIAFGDRPSGNSDIFIINVDGSGLHKLTDDPLADTGPTFTPDGAELIFERNFHGITRLYVMKLDGSDQRQLTGSGGYEMTASFSPDGRSLLFAADPQDALSRGLDIFVTDFKQPDIGRRILTRRFHDTGPAVSPDGSKIVFNAQSEGNPEIYLMNADGSGLVRLTHDRSNDTVPQFSLDGKSIIFSSDRSGNAALYKLPLPF
jgi:Tol biopolymer transport system component/DNA-binding winged helix-turn-helix (wHTH) protein